MRPDVVVVGAGLGGLTSALRLAESGARVLVVATGAGSISLAPATIDVFGYAGGDRVQDPLEAIARADACHPYAAIGRDAVSAALDWLVDTVARGPLDGYEYWGRGSDNMLLPTALGAVKPTALAPSSIAAGDVREAQQVLVAGIDGLKDFHPRLIAANLNRSQTGVQARWTSLPRPRGLSLEPNTLNLGRFLDDERNARALGRELRERVLADEAIALPAIAGLQRPGQALAAIGEETRRTVYEIPTLPPSIPGMRLARVLTLLLRRAGGQVVHHARVTGADRRGARVTALRAWVSGRERAYSAPDFVLATGGLASGAIALGSDWTVRETALGLDVAHAPAPGAARFEREYFASHPLSKAGVAVDEQLRPLSPALENLRVVGATIAGAEPWHEKSGDGIALSSGYKAAGLIAGERQIAPQGAAA